MALCDYHEDLEAVATCVVCKSSICERCQEHGANGMCGMCLEMSNARKAEMEASRQARVAAAGAPAATPRPAAPKPPAAPPKPGAAPPKPPAAPPRPPGKATTGNLAKPAAAASKVVPPAGSKPAAKAGFCGEHDGQTLTAACTNCRKKVCPYCLDLYDLCTECRHLPHCSRHESMVAAAKCQSCNLDYCRLCLDNTPFCDRCRTVGMAAVKNAERAPKATTGKLDPAKAARPDAPRPAKGTTGKLDPAAAARPPAEAGAPPPKKTPITPPKPGQPGYRPPGKGAAASAKKAGGPPALAYVAGGLVLFAAAAYLIIGDGRPRLSRDEANAAVRQEMNMVLAASRTIMDRTGRPPDSVDQLLEQIASQGVDLKKVNPPLKLVLNGPATDPLTITVATQPKTFEIRALDADGRSLAENGRDVVLTPPEPEEEERRGGSRREEPRREERPADPAPADGAEEPAAPPPPQATEVRREVAPPPAEPEGAGRRATPAEGAAAGRNRTSTAADPQPAASSVPAEPPPAEDAPADAGTSTR